MRRALATLRLSTLLVYQGTTTCTRYRSRPPVNNPCNLEAFDENEAKEKVIMSEVDLCLCRKTAKRLLDEFVSAELEEDAVIVVEAYSLMLENACGGFQE